MDFYRKLDSSHTKPYIQKDPILEAIMHNCKDSNCAKWFINPQGKAELFGNILKSGTTLCADCVKRMAAEVGEEKPKKEKPKASAKKA